MHRVVRKSTRFWLAIAVDIVINAKPCQSLTRPLARGNHFRHARCQKTRVTDGFVVFRSDRTLLASDVRRGRLNTDPPAPVATGQTVMACTPLLARAKLLAFGLEFLVILCR